MTRMLVLVRHGQSEWNFKNLFTGKMNPPLTPVGVNEAISVGKKFIEHGISFDAAFSSSLKRSQDTCKLILKEVNQENIQPIYSAALNERDYGDLSGMNKDDARKRWGDYQVNIWRRSYDVSPPRGESLRDTSARVLSYYLTSILPVILQNKSVLVTAHGNSLRSLLMVLDGINSDSIADVNIDTGEPILYHLNTDSTVISKKIFRKT
ncbi:2,3-bisphosphoglycerate-dependent phosphoglycerate mutase [Candidatus Liberibacter americanus]|uniref:2,3-bisphosphoglycerate-dependent phosphoglycerate mutase n=1 Tax=Candidatus Liberibacter americanus str. Sao Paulo TaxID=1261131 RepID=U6B5S3_9HYPH|nr:2,3-bisphosphoglycerate-dependent phosphoglycerate mutase [Candidatus Liberibacter americanus]AHA28203.1 Phosphoglycerate mutase 1 [Candidatus Liberibacter americanus str. Sao Paulo]EMS36283.1 phosphoglyceromutase [Candidatus Liberibacter americanus PW_SP]